MDGLLKTTEKKELEAEFSFKNLFFPLTTLKAIHWIIIIGLVVYANMLFNGFVWDDHFQIVDNVAVHNGNYFYYFAHSIGPYYRPLMLFLYTGLFQLFNLNPFPFHLLQLVFHILNSVLVFLLFKHFTKKKVIPLLFAFIFLVHPMNAEPVDYIANLQDILFVFFGLLSVLSVLKLKLNTYSVFFIALLIFFSLLAKETGVLFLVLCCVLVVMLNKKKRIVSLIVLSTSFLCYLLLRLTLIGSIKPTNFNFIPLNTVLSLPFSERILSIPKIIFFYLTTFFYPSDLTAKYWYVRTFTIQDFFLPLFFDLLFLILLSLIGAFLSKKKVNGFIHYWFFFLWFWIGIGLHLQLIPLDKTVADRWFYFPMIGLLGMGLIAICSIKITLDRLALKGISFFVIIIIFSMSILTMERNAVWHDDMTLYSHDITSMEDVADIQYNYGTALLEAGDYQQAKDHLQKGSQLAPNSYQIWHNLGVVYLQLKQFDKAKACFEKEVNLNHAMSSTYLALAYISLEQNEPENAKNILMLAIKKWPNDPFLWRMLGLAYYQLKNVEFAQNAFEKSLSITPMPTTQYYISQLKQNLPIEIIEF